MKILMLFRLLGPALVLTLAVACSDDGEEESPPAASVQPASESPRPSSESLGAGEQWFRGQVREVNTGCYADGICSVRVEVSEALGGEKLATGEVADVIFGIGWVNCLGRQDEAAIQVGATVEVKAGAYEYDGSKLSICGDAGYSLLSVPE